MKLGNGRQVLVIMPVMQLAAIVMCIIVFTLLRCFGRRTFSLEDCSWESPQSVGPTTITTPPGSWLEMHSLCPTPDLPNQTLHLNKVPR